MPNEEIFSALKNAIDHGESLESAVQIMIDSGYNSEEVQEASKFIGGTLSMQEVSPEEQLTMPEEKKTFTSKFKFWGKDKKQDQTPQIIQTQQPQTQQKPMQQPIQQLPQLIQQPMQQPIQQLPQYSQQITQTQIKQSFQHPMQQYPQSFQQPQTFQQPIKQYPQYPQQPIQQPIIRQAPRPISQLIPRQGELSREIQKIKPAKQGYMKEIILLIILLVLIGVLVATILFKDTILGWFA